MSRSSITQPSNNKAYCDRIDEMLFGILFFVNTLVGMTFISTMSGIRMSAFLLAAESIILLLAFIRFFRFTSSQINKLSYLMIAVLAASAIFYLSIQKYFNVVLWDSADYLLNAKMLITNVPIIYEFYKPLTWSAFLSMGLLFDDIHFVPMITCIMMVAATYLFSLTLTGNKKAAIVSSALMILSPVFLIWGETQYADAYLALLITTGFASYFHFTNTGNKLYFRFSVFLFMMAALTKYNFLLIMLIPAIEFFRRKLYFSSTIPALTLVLPYLIYEKAETNNFVYPILHSVDGFRPFIGNSIFFNSYYISNMDYLFSWVLFITGMFGVLLLIKKAKESRLLSSNLMKVLLVFFLEAVFLFVFFPAKDIRYFMFAVPLVTLSSALFLEHFVIMFFSLNLDRVLFISFIFVMIILAANFCLKVIPWYKYSSTDIARQASLYLGNTSSNVMSNSPTILAWYLQRKVVTAPEIGKLNETIRDDNVTYLVNFEESGEPPEFRDTALLLGYGKLLTSYSNKYEKINIIEIGNFTP